jgi:hypothetical protein
MIKLLKIKYLMHLRSKKFQITFINSYSSKAFSNNTKNAPKLSYDFYFWFKWILNEKLFNIQWLLYHRWKTLRNQFGATPYSLRGLSNGTKKVTRSHDLGDLDVPNKQNKQGVCHTRALLFASKIILRQKKNTQIFPHAKI